MTKEQKARIVDLARIAEKCLRDIAAGPTTSYPAKLDLILASAEAFRIAAGGAA